MSEITRYKSLDGLRALAILLVLSSHARPSPGMPAYPQWWWHLGDLGNLGVRIFFVLSGFIITHLLLREGERQGHLSLRAFYVRRLFRIIPPVFALLMFVWVGMRLGWWQVSWRQFIMALFFLGNYVGPSGSWTIGHLWSLAVEEQFYLLWPIILVITTRYTRCRFLVIAASLVSAPLLRVACLTHSTDTETGFIQNSDALAMGAFAALIFSGTMFSYFRRMMESVPVMVSGAMVIMLNLELVPDALKVTVCYPLIHLCVASLIFRVIRNERDFGSRLLSSTPLVFIGVISYSLYLFQQPVFNRPPVKMLPGYPWPLVLVFTLAIACHFLIERPSVKVRNYFLRK